MKILVTGGNGFIGSNLIKKLLSEGHNVVSLDDLSTGLKEYEVEGCNYVYGDIENLLYWKGDNFDLVYHLAALARIQPSFDDPMETFRVDTFGVQIVAEWARQNDVKVVYAGSSSRWCNPETSPYATCKKLGEDILKMYRTAYGFFKERFEHIEKVHLPDVAGNYRQTLRENDDTLERLDWAPTDRLKEYILSL